MLTKSFFMHVFEKLLFSDHSGGNGIVLGTMTKVT